MYQFGVGAWGGGGNVVSRKDLWKCWSYAGTDMGKSAVGCVNSMCKGSGLGKSLAQLRTREIIVTGA